MFFSGLRTSGSDKHRHKMPQNYLVRAYFTRHFATKMSLPTDLGRIPHRLRQASLILAGHGYFANRLLAFCNGRLNYDH